MPPTADGKLASRVGRPVKDEAYTCNIINYSNPLKDQFRGTFFIESCISKEKVNTGCEGNFSFSGKALKGNFWLFKAKNREVSTALCQNQFVKYYGCCMCEAFCMLFGVAVEVKGVFL